MAVISKVIILAIAAVIALACALGFLFFFKSDSNSKQKPEDAPEYYKEGPLRSYNFCGGRKVIALTFDDGNQCFEHHVVSTVIHILTDQGPT